MKLVTKKVSRYMKKSYIEQIQGFLHAQYFVISPLCSRTSLILSGMLSVSFLK
jgi:hypothetical protein